MGGEHPVRMCGRLDMTQPSSSSRSSNANRVTENRRATQRARVKIRISQMTATTLQARTPVFSGYFATRARARRAADPGKILNCLDFFHIGRGSVADRARFSFERLCHNWQQPKASKIQVLRAVLLISRSERTKFLERKNRVVPVQTGTFTWLWRFCHERDVAAQTHASLSFSHDSSATTVRAMIRNGVPRIMKSCQSPRVG